MKKINYKVLMLLLILTTSCSNEDKVVDSDVVTINIPASTNMIIGNRNIVNNKASKTSVTINNKTYAGKNVNVIGNKVVVDDVEYTIEDKNDMNITFK